MTKGIRWRVLVLQVGLVGILGFVAGFAFWAANFSHSTVQDELTAQQIYFPDANSKAVTSLPAADASAMAQYSNQQLVNGEQAKVYANSFIAVHLDEVAGGQTYAQMSAKALADPKNAQLQAQVQTLFRGETLRGLLLNAYGWWTMGTYAFWAAIGLSIAAFAVLCALIFELYLWWAASRKPAVVEISAPTAKAPAA